MTRFWAALAAGVTTAATVASVLVVIAPQGAAAEPRPHSSAGYRDLSAGRSPPLRWFDPRTPSAPAPAADRLLVKLSSRMAQARSTARAELARGDRRSESLGGRWFLVTGTSDTAEARRDLTRTPGVLAVQRDHVRQAFGDRYYRRYQPYLRASMDVNAAWKRSSGRGVVVAVLDTGVDVRHEDIGRTLRGRDFVDGDRTTQDPVGHGTFVSGVIAAQRDNGKGIAGVSRASVLPVRVLNGRGYGRDSTIAKAIRWSVQHDADIINLSLGGARRGHILRDAVNFADSHGVLVIASAGNDGGTAPRYPAAFESAVAVGATDLNDRMVWWSQHGEWLDVVAPGHRIVSTVPGDRYAMGSGTSFSAPLVSGAAALILSRHRDWTDEELRDAVLGSAADAGPVGPDPFTGLGVPDVDGALGGAARAAVPLTGPLTGTMPGNAKALTRNSAIAASSPEGTDRWFALQVDQPSRVTVTANSGGRSSVLRGDIELTMYDGTLGRLDHSSSRARLGTEQVTAVVDDTVYVRVANLADTRWPARVELGLRRDAATAGQVQGGSAARPVLISSTPAAESYGADPLLPLTFTTGVDIRPASVDAQSLQLLDGSSGQPVAADIDAEPDGWRVTPTAPLTPVTDYALVLSGATTTAGDRVPYTRVGFRTQ